MALWPNLDVLRIRLRDANTIIAEVDPETSIDEIRRTAIDAGVTGTVYAEPITQKEGALRREAIGIALRGAKALESPLLDPELLEHRREDAEAKRAERDASTRILQANIHASAHTAEMRILQIEQRAAQQIDDNERRYQRELSRVQLQADDAAIRLQRSIDQLEDDLRNMRNRHDARLEQARAEEQSIAARRMASLEDAQARERMQWDTDRERLERLIADLRAETAQLRKKWTETQSEVLEAQREAASAKGQAQGVVSRDVANMQAMAELARTSPALLPVVMARLNPEDAPHPIERAIDRVAPLIDRLLTMRQIAAQRPVTPIEGEDERL